MNFRFFIKIINNYLEKVMDLKIWLYIWLTNYRFSKIATIFMIWKIYIPQKIAYVLPCQILFHAGLAAHLLTLKQIFFIKKLFHKNEYYEKSHKF